MGTGYLDKLIICTLTLLCISCGVHRDDFAECIKPLVLSSLEDGDFVYHEPLGKWHALKVLIDPKWGDASICIKHPHYTDSDCYKYYENRYSIKPLPATRQLNIDGYVKVERFWSIIPMGEYRRRVFLRGHFGGEYYWLSTGYIRRLINYEGYEKANSLVKLNKDAFEYLEKDRKLELGPASNGWPCDPQLSQNQ